MTTNGHKSTLRVLLTGAAAHRLHGLLEGRDGLSLITMASRNGKPADVALHVIDASAANVVGDSVRELRELTDVPLILAAFGEPNGIVETGLQVGAADVVLLPQPAETLLFSLRKAALAAFAGKTGKVVTVFSPKGGTGKTVLATNLAAASARMGIDTLLVDLDLQFGDSALTLAVAPPATIADLAAASGAVDIDKLNAFVSTDPRTGLALLAAPKRPEEAEIVGQSELGAILDAARNGYGAVVVDTGPLFDGAMLAALDRSDQLLLVCNPELTSLKNVRIGLETIDRLGFPRERVSLVANRLGAAGAVSRESIEQALDAEISFDLPDDPAVPAAINRALPVVLADERSRFTRAVADLAASVFAEPPASEPAPSQRRFLLRGRR
jgi:pilus assembly protein CpaE